MSCFNIIGHGFHTDVDVDDDDAVLLLVLVVVVAGDELDLDAGVIFCC